MPGHRANSGMNQCSSQSRIQVARLNMAKYAAAQPAPIVYRIQILLKAADANPNTIAIRSDFKPSQNFMFSLSKVEDPCSHRACGGHHRASFRPSNPRQLHTRCARDWSCSVTPPSKRQIQEPGASHALIASLVTSVGFESVRKRVSAFAETVSKPEALQASIRSTDGAPAPADSIASEQHAGTRT
jgi:hypothetical protein